MIKEALYHRIDSEFSYFTSDGSVTLRLRAAKDDKISCTLLYGERYFPGEFPPFARVPMKKKGSGLLFDYYEAIIKPGYERLFYLFEISDSTETVWYFQGDIHDSATAFRRNRYYQMPFALREEAYDVPDWAKTAVMYQIFPDSFATGKRQHSGHAEAYEAFAAGRQLKEKKTQTPQGISKSLHGGNFKGITENVEWIKDLGINCVYLNPIFSAVSYHKYDTNDYKQVDPCFGSDEDFRLLVKTLHENGIRVVLDGVFNHSGIHFFAWQDILKNQEKSQYKDWYYDVSFPVKDWHSKYACFAYVKSMPKLNLAHPEAAAYFAEVGAYWIREYDIDGWRLDVANEVHKSFWRTFRTAVRAEKADALLIGEVWEDAQNWQTYDLFDSAMNYRFTYACIDFIAHQKMTSKEFGERFVDMTMRYPQPVSDVQMNLLDSHDVERFLYFCDGNLEKQKLAVALQMTLPGMPSIFAGSERAMNGESEREYRLPFLWPGLTENEAERDAMTDWYKRLIRLRHETKALTSSDISFIATENPALLVFSRGIEKGKRVLVVLNNSNKDCQYAPQIHSPLQSMLTKKEVAVGDILQIPALSVDFFLY